MGYQQGLLEYLTEHDFTEGVIIAHDKHSKQGQAVLRFFYNFQDHEWMIREVK
jgi:hypothetical protein